MSSSTASIPLRMPRLISLFMAFAWAVIAGSAGLNALVKSNQQQSSVRKILPPGTTLDVEDNDVFHTGVVITTVSALIALLTFIYMVILLSAMSSTRKTSPTSLTRSARLSNRILPFESISLAFCAIWLFATQIPFTHFFATRSAGVRAFSGGVEINPALVQIIQNELGFETTYRKIGYLRLVAILPWFTILFTAIASAVSFAASRRRPTKI
ncbi:hypothetical protein GYMLUDRAFT_241834 [Collybiopsis luxurians FD-317 M1]|uniref:Uncharacterized protein n=1 Tax=Collybiopsis luxurians FD-317 M1 TaxID=944289 RepID=A0A0D0C5C2_9AGAR|nr:hypothetical protein GYMLUDRAFT_241834 [Collybiopsis luxurians FD-317 M1]